MHSHKYKLNGHLLFFVSLKYLPSLFFHLAEGKNSDNFVAVNET